MRRAKLKVYSVVMLESLNRPTHRADRADRMLADPYRQNWLYVANSSWLRDAVRARGQHCEMVLAAPRADIFRPDAAPADKGRHSVVMCLQSRGQWKGSERSAAAIGYARSRWTGGGKIEVRCFGPGKPPAFGRPLRRLGVTAVHELPAHYAAADVVLHSSAFEGWANVPFEAMCCGTPFVTFDTPGIRDFAVDGFNCRIVPPFDTDAMGEAMLEVLLDRGLRERLRRGCAEMYRRFCAIDTVAEIERIAAVGLARAAEAMRQ
jgi:glycosyltransferase involved in cell wall biosynthesis